jgi:hypothetical protein
LCISIQRGSARDLSLAAIAAGFALFAADLSAAPWLGHEETPFADEEDEPGAKRSVAGRDRLA